MITIVCTTPDKPERRAHMDALCAREGLSPQYTTDLGLFVHRDDPRCAEGRLGEHPRAGLI